MSTSTDPRLTVLSGLDLGHRVAEQESDELAGYFVETDQWSQLVRGNVDVVYGSKGSGKSALYSLLLHKASELFDSGVVVVQVENRSGKPAFHSIAADPPHDERELLIIWKLYFLTVVADVLQEWSIESPEAVRVYTALESAGLLQPRKLLSQVLARVRAYARKLMDWQAAEPAADTDIGTLRITLTEPDQSLRDVGVVSIDELLADADTALHHADFSVWLILDRLDVAFAGSAQLEQRALRALFRTYLDMQGLRRISLKLFLRSDIWHRITREGFREASHITRSLTITWDRQSLLQLISRRLLKNATLRQHLKLAATDVEADGQAADALVARVLPHDLDLGSNMDPIEWTLNAVQDGSREVAPRELIHLLTAARQEQIRRLESGHTLPSGDELFDAVSMELALETVSHVRLTQTLYAEYPDLRRFVSRLEGEASQLSLQTLSMVWGVSTSSAERAAEELLDVGFFERRRSKRHPNFVIPLLYRPALRIKEGSSDAFLAFGRQVIDQAAHTLVKGLNIAAQRPQIARSHSGEGTELIILEFTDQKYRRRMFLWLFAAESGTPLSLRDTEGALGSLSDGIGAALLVADGSELEFDEYRERFGGTQFRWMPHFRSRRAGARLFVPYSQLSGRSPTESADALLSRLIKPLRDAEMIARPKDGWNLLVRSGNLTGLTDLSGHSTTPPRRR